MRDFDEELNVKRQTDDGFKKFKNTAGFMLVLIGVSLILWVVLKAIYIFDDPGSLIGFKELLTKPIEAEIDKTKMLIPLEALTYFIPLGLLFLFLSAGNMLLMAGIKLLDNDFQILIRRIP